MCPPSTPTGTSRRRRFGCRPIARHPRTEADAWSVVEPRRQDPKAGSVAVAGRVRAAPRPGRADHLLEAGATRLPAEDVAGPAVGGDEHGRVARATRPDGVRDLGPGDRRRDREHLLDGEAGGRPEVADERGAGALAWTGPWVRRFGRQ